MAPESPSGSWDARRTRHGFSKEELNLNRSLMHQQHDEDDRRDEDEPVRRFPREKGEPLEGRERQRRMNDDYRKEEDRHHSRHYNRSSNHESSRVVVGLDLNIGQTPPPDYSPTINRHRAPNSKPGLAGRTAPVSSRGELSPPPGSPHVAVDAAGDGRKSAPSLPKRSSRRKRHEQVSPPQSPPPPVSRQQQEPVSSPPPSKRSRRPPARKRSPEEKPQPRHSPSPVRRRDPSVEPPPAEVARKRSPHVVVEQRRLLSPPLRRRDVSIETPVAEGRRRSPYAPLERRRSMTPVRRERRDASVEPERGLAVSPVRRRSITPVKRRSVTPVRRERRDVVPTVLPVVSEGGRRRSVTPLRNRSPSREPVQKGSPLIMADRGRSLTPLKRGEESVTPLRRGDGPGESAGDGERRRYASRSVTPLRRRASSPEPVAPGEGKRSPVEGTRRRAMSRTPPLRHRERSRTRSPVRRRSPSNLATRRTRSPQPRRRSPRRSPRRDRSPGGRSSPRRSSPGRYRGSRRDRRNSPAGRRGWSPVQNRSNGVGKPGNNLFIAGFNFITTERDLERKFSRYGRVMDVRIVRDKRSGESRGFGFLTLERDEDADAAIRSLDQTEWNGRIVLVEKAKTPTRF